MQTRTRSGAFRARWINLLPVRYYHDNQIHVSFLSLKQTSLLFPKDDENTCFIRTNEVDINLSLLFELTVSVKKTDAKGRNELTSATMNPISNQLSLVAIFSKHTAHWAKCWMGSTSPLHIGRGTNRKQNISNQALSRNAIWQELEGRRNSQQRYV